MWAEVYGFLKEGRGPASRTDKYVDGKFSTPINPKDGHAVADCVDPKERRVLKFVLPILYPEKRNRITMTVGNTIFGALSKVRKVSWGQVIQEVVGKLVSNLEKGKPFPISPYLFHLYHRFECLRGDEMDMLESMKYCLEYGVSPEAEAQPETEDLGSDWESLSSAEQRKLKMMSPRSRRKKTSYRAMEGKTPLQLPNWKAIAMTSFNFEDNPFWRVWEEMDQLQGQYSKLEFITREIYKLLGDCKPTNIYK